MDEYPFYLDGTGALQKRQPPRHETIEERLERILDKLIEVLEERLDQIKQLNKELEGLK